MNAATRLLSAAADPNRLAPTMRVVAAIGAMVKDVDLESALTAVRDADALGPLGAPAEWAAARPQIAHSLALLEPLVEFQRAVRAAVQAHARG